MLISDVEARKKILFGSLSSGISTKTKKKLAWENLAPSVNEVGADSPTVADIRKKVVGHQGERKKKRSLPTGEAWVRRAAESGSSPYLSCERGWAPFWLVVPPASHQHAFIFSYLDAC